MLEEYGVAVVPNVLSPDKCQAAMDGLWSGFEGICADMQPALNRADPSTYKALLNLLPKQGMMYQQYVNHLQCVWNVREDENVIRAFQHLHKTTDPMIVSFDGVAFLPVELSRSSVYCRWKKRLPFHTDQSFYDTTSNCIQGFITLADVEDGDATLAVLAGSHKYQAEFLKWRYETAVIEKKPNTKEQKEAVKALRKDWYKFSDDEMLFYSTVRYCPERYIKAKAGSLILWRTTVHCAKKPEYDRPDPHPRAVIYVCMTPRKDCPEKMLKERVSKFEALRGTSHYPYKARLFPEHPYLKGKPRPVVRVPPAPTLTAVGRLLVGYPPETDVDQPQTTECSG